MSRSINIKSLALLLSRYLFYGIIPISLMGMMAGGGPPGDPYIQAYNALTARYAATNQNTNQFLNNYSNSLLLTMTAMRDGANEASIWAQHQATLAEIDFDTVDIIRQRIAIILGHIAQHATGAQGRAAAVQANAPGAALLPGDQNILNVLDQANTISQQAGSALDRSEGAVNQAQGFIQNINNRLNAIQQRINQMNQPILGINYTNNDIIAYNQNLTSTKNDSNYINMRAFYVKERALTAHNELNNIRQFMQNIVQLGTNLGIQLPPY